MEDIFKGRWNEFKGKIKEQWGELTDDEIAQAEGNTDQLIGKIQQKYGGTKEDIRHQLETMRGPHQATR